MLFRLWFPHVLPSSFIIVIIMFIIFVLLSFSLLSLSFFPPPLPRPSSSLRCPFLYLLISTLSSSSSAFVCVHFLHASSLITNLILFTCFPFFSILDFYFFFIFCLFSTTIWHLHQFCKNGQKLSILRSCFALKSSWVNFTLTLWMVIFADTCTQHCLFLPYLWVAHPWHFMHWQLSTLLCRDLNCEQPRLLQGPKDRKFK